MLTGAQEGRVRGDQLTPIKFGAEVRNFIWRLCWAGVKSNGNDHLSNNRHDFKGWCEIQRIVLRDKT